MTDNKDEEIPGIGRYNLRKRKYKQGILESASVSSPIKTPKKLGKIVFHKKYLLLTKSKLWNCGPGGTCHTLFDELITKYPNTFCGTGCSNIKC